MCGLDAFGETICARALVMQLIWDQAMASLSAALSALVLLEKCWFKRYGVNAKLNGNVEQDLAEFLITRNFLNRS
jgi:hypothetical protein